jgi:hypothetical protein
MLAEALRKCRRSGSVSWNSDEYASYLDGKDTRFPTREAKLHRMRDELDKLKSSGVQSRDLMQRIRAGFGFDSQISKTN